MDTDQKVWLKNSIRLGEEHVNYIDQSLSDYEIDLEDWKRKAETANKKIALIELRLLQFQRAKIEAIKSVKDFYELYYTPSDRVDVVNVNIAESQVARE